MNDVHQWKPTSSVLTADHSRILNKLVVEMDEQRISATEEELANLRPVILADQNAWQNFVADLDDATIVSWVRVLTLLESQYSGFECGAKSPVIALVKVLRKRGSYPPDLSSWIKSNTTNRFLPYGSLLDRL